MTFDDFAKGMRAFDAAVRELDDGAGSRAFDLAAQIVDPHWFQDEVHLTDEGLPREGEAVASFVLAQGLASPWYTGPVIVNGTAWWVGANASHNVRPSDPAWAIGVTLAEVAPGEVRATPRVRTAIPTQEPMYVSPAVLGDALFTVDVGGGVWRVDTGTGAVTAHGTVQVGPVYPSPLAIGGRLLVGGESGTFVVIDPRAPATPLFTHTLPRTRATPAPAEGALFVRTLDGLLCVGSPR